MSDTDWIDARALHADYHRDTCPECGVDRWFKHRERDHWPVDQYNCERCGSSLRETLEYPCPECDVRMVLDGDQFVCHVRDCDHDATAIDRDALIDRLTDDYETAGYQYGARQECPACNKRSILNGPDGERACDECGRFYAGRFADAWFCYALWLRDRDRIRVTVGDGE